MNLVVLTKQFGNYTGATVSTIEILKRISKKFDTVEVVTMKAEKVNIPNVKILIISNCFDLIKILKLKKCEKKVYGYSDDHLGFLFSLVNIPYVHTYHGNWPDVRWTNIEMFIKSLFFIPMYKLTIKKANQVISVSKYMDSKFVRKYTKKSTVIYNGIKQMNKCYLSSKVKNKFLMVGNVDSRKYKKAIKLMKILSASGFNGEIDVYGNIMDRRISYKLSRYSFVNLKGVANKIIYNNYSALICTSSSENLPVSIVESLSNSVPVISFDVGGVREIIKNKINGFVINKFDYKKFVNDIFELKNYNLNMDNKRIKKIFNWDYASEKYMKIIMNIR